MKVFIVYLTYFDVILGRSMMHRRYMESVVHIGRSISRRRDDKDNLKRVS